MDTLLIFKRNVHVVWDYDSLRSQRGRWCPKCLFSPNRKPTGWILAWCSTNISCLRREVGSSHRWTWSHSTTTSHYRVYAFTVLHTHTVQTYLKIKLGRCDSVGRAGCKCLIEGLADTFPARTDHMAKLWAKNKRKMPSVKLAAAICVHERHFNHEGVDNAL